MSLLIKALKQAEKEHQKALAESPSLDGADGYGGEPAPAAKPARAPRAAAPAQAPAPNEIGLAQGPNQDSPLGETSDDDIGAMALMAEEPIADRPSPALLPRHAAPLDDHRVSHADIPPAIDELTLESQGTEGLMMDPLPAARPAEASFAAPPMPTIGAASEAAQTQAMPTLQIKAGHAGRSRLMLMMSGALVVGAIVAWLALQWMQPLAVSPGPPGPDDALLVTNDRPTQAGQQPVMGQTNPSLASTGTLVAEGSHVASAPFDGFVPTPPAPSVSTVPARPATPRANSRPPVARTARAAAVGTPREPALKPMPGANSRPAVLARTRQATADTARQPGRQDGVRFQRTDSPAEQRRRLLTEAYQSLRDSRFAQAEQLYLDALAIDRNSVDAWLGLATLAAHANRPDLARQHYQQALQIDPKDAVAQAGLLSVQNTGDPVTRESQLRNLQASGAAGAPMKFSLGNSLAAQQRWPEAQQAYFDASAAEPTHPDYAFNLAIALERIHQPRAAREQYQRALDLASRRPASFELETARQRIRVLGDQATGQ